MAADAVRGEPRELEPLTAMSGVVFRVPSKNFNDLAGMMTCLGAGARLAWNGACGALAALLLFGCLVTDPIEFESEQGSPPVLLDVPGTATPLGYIVWLDSRISSSWRFMLRVRDEDLGQQLTVHYRIVREGEAAPDFEPPLSVPKNGALTRDFWLQIQSGQLRVGECHRLDIAVSGSFFEGRDNPIYFDEVREEGDLARGTFWIWEGKGETVATLQEKARLVDSCNAIEELLAPSGTTEDVSP